jgi:hypothetical protein
LFIVKGAGRQRARYDAGSTVALKRESMRLLSEMKRTFYNMLESNFGNRVRKRRQGKQSIAREKVQSSRKN